MCRSAELLRMRTRSGDLFRTRSIIHRRGDSFSSLRSDENAGDLEDSEQRPLFFMHGVGLGLVSVHCLSCGRLLLQACGALMEPEIAMGLPCEPLTGISMAAAGSHCRSSDDSVASGDASEAIDMQMR